MSQPKPPFVENAENIFAYTCCRYLDAVQKLQAAGHNDAAGLLVDITEGAMLIQQQLVDLLCPLPDTNLSEAYSSMRACAEGVLGAIERLESITVRPCVDCQFYKDVSGTAHCASPRNRLVDLVYGTDKQMEAHCETLRSDDVRYCGKHGRWFEKKEDGEQVLH